MSSRLKWYVGVVCVAAIISLTGLVRSIDLSRLHGALPVIAMFSTLLILGEFFPIAIRHRNQTKEVVVTSTFAFAMVPVVGPGVAVLAHVATSILADAIHRKAPIKATFNAAQCVLALGSGGAIYTVAGGTFDITARGLPAFVLGAVVFAGVNHMLVSAVVALAEGTPIRAGILSDLRLELMSSALLLALAPVAVILAEHSLFLVPALVSPLAAVYLASKGWAGAEEATERQRRLTKQEQEVVKRLQEADRMKADLLATVTHELRSPLTTILGALQLLELRNHKLTPEHRLDFIQMGLRQGERLHRMIEQLLLAARFERSPKGAAPNSLRVELDASELVRQAAEEAQTRHHERAIVVQANGALPVRVVHDAVSQVLANMVDNACKYSPEGRPVHLSGTRLNGHAVLAVEDCGPGVDPGDRDRIFERFTQLDDSSHRGGGVGLGLYIARELARSQGGDLLVTDPTSTDGARFELRLPLHKA
jgi:signal transduction histidine kinase